MKLPFFVEKEEIDKLYDKQIVTYSCYFFISFYSNIN